MSRARYALPLLLLLAASCTSLRPRLRRGGDVALPVQSTWGMLLQGANSGCTKTVTSLFIPAQQIDTPLDQPKCVSMDSLRAMGNRTALTPIAVP